MGRHLGGLNCLSRRFVFTLQSETANVESTARFEKSFFEHRDADTDVYLSQWKIFRCVNEVALLQLNEVFQTSFLFIERYQRMRRYALPSRSLLFFISQHMLIKF